MIESIFTPEWVCLPGPAGHHLGQVMQSAIEALGLPANQHVAGGSCDAQAHFACAPLQFPAAKQVCVVLADGMGAKLLEQCGGHARFLSSLPAVTKPVFTCIPSTTAAAITCLTTGTLPGATQMFGYELYNPATKDNFNLITFAQSHTPATVWQSVPTWFERWPDLTTAAPVGAIGPKKFVDSGLTNAALRGCEYLEAESLDARVSKAVSSLKQGKKLVYLYWADLDHLGHQYGWSSTAWVNALEEFDAGMNRLVNSVPPQTLIIITADHGMVDSGGQWIIDLAHTPELAKGVVATAGEPRALQVYCEPGHATEVSNRWQQYLADKAYIVPVQMMPELWGRGSGKYECWDFTAFMGQNWSIMDSRRQKPSVFKMIGMHGSLTAQEMQVPLYQVLV